MTDPRVTRFRLRLLVAAGVAFGSGRVLPAVRAAGTDSSGGSSGTDSGSESDTSSSDGSSSSSSGGSSSTSPGSDGSTGDDGDFIGCGGCYGRPYVAGQRIRVAAAIDSSAWPIEARIAGLDELGVSQREALAAFWIAAGLSEHSSVAGFHRFALDLLCHGAPFELVASAQRAATQELEHARACFSLASAYAARGVGPGPIALGPAAPVAESLVELAVWTVHEGCVGETVAAWLASEIHEHAENEVVREVMAKIAAEEAEHAELAWATIRWAIATGGQPVALAVAAAFRSARVTPPHETRIHCTAHGLLPCDAIARSMQRAFAEIVQPCARELLSA